MNESYALRAIVGGLPYRAIPAPIATRTAATSTAANAIRTVLPNVKFRSTSCTSIADAAARTANSSSASATPVPVVRRLRKHRALPRERAVTRREHDRERGPRQNADRHGGELQPSRVEREQHDEPANRASHAPRLNVKYIVGTSTSRLAAASARVTGRVPRAANPSATTAAIAAKTPSPFQ